MGVVRGGVRVRGCGDGLELVASVSIPAQNCGCLLSS